jgi:outer membrane protein assembly factor BamE (lipoprotein component of BamABCDE complex)
MVRPLLSTAVLTSSLLCGGCLVGGHSNVERRGTYVAESTLTQIRPRETDKAWVRAVVGEPDERVRVDQTRELWKYAYTETKSSRGHVFLIFGGSDRKVTQGNVFVEFDGDLVAKTWRG